MKDIHPCCCFCGGGRPTETIEHAPPRVFFRNKQRGKGLEFPACKRCNNGTSQLDQVAALFALIMGDALNQNDDDAYFNKLLSGVRNNCPEVIDYFKKDAPLIGVEVDGNVIEVNQVPFDSKLNTDWLYPWSAKQGCALWYEHTNKIVDTEQLIYVDWATNYRLITRGLPKELIEIAPNINAIKQGKLDFSDQYFYRYNVDIDRRIGYFLIGIHRSAFITIFIFNKDLFDLEENLAQKKKIFEIDPDQGLRSHRVCIA